MSAGFYLAMSSPEGTQNRRIEGDLLTIGRADDCDLCIANDTINRRHMSVHLSGRECWIEDHGSMSGTFVNGTRIKPHLMVRVFPEDRIRIGQTEYEFSASSEPYVWKEEAPSGEEVIQVTTVDQRLSDLPNLQVTVSSPDIGESQSHKKKNVPVQSKDLADELVQQAYQRAAAIVQEAELEAEKVAQDIYRKAHDKQLKVDEEIQRKLANSYREIEASFQKAQSEAGEVMVRARRSAVELRAQAEIFVEELRQRTERECLQSLEEAKRTARELKEARLQEAEEIIQGREAEIIAGANKKVAERIEQFESDLKKEGARQRESIDIELKDKIDKIASLKQEVAELEERRQECNRLNESIRQLSAHADSLKAERLELGREVSQLTKERADGKAILDKLRAAEESMDSELVRVRERFEGEKAKIQRAETAHREELRLASLKRVQELEEKLVAEMIERRDVFLRELVLNVELYLNQHAEVDLKDLKADLHRRLQATFDDRLSSVTSVKGSLTTQGVWALKFRQKLAMGTLGACLGLVAAYIAPQIMRAARAPSPPPLQRKVASVIEERKADLERRKFSPPQTPEVRHRYTDSIIYTKDYAKNFLSDEFQKSLFKAARPHLFKLFRVSEEKTIQTIAAASALVQALQDKREAIHPDFVDSGIEKMRTMEVDTIEKLKPILGSSVRVDAYRKFERKFYEDFRKQASTAPNAKRQPSTSSGY